jgi:hypothetical protein
LSHKQFFKHEKTSLNGPLRLLHHHAGYLRVQANVFIGLSDKDELVVAANKSMEGVTGVRRITHHPKTGSFVIEYDAGEVDSDHLLDRISNKTGLSGVVIDIHSKAHRREFVDSFLDAVVEVNRIAGRATDGRADLRELVPAAFAAVSVITFTLGDRRGSRLPRWDSALYHGYRIFMQWHRDEVRDREKTARRYEERSEKKLEAGRDFR